MSPLFARLALGAIVGSVLVVAAPAPAQAAVGKVNPPALWYKIAGDVSEADAVAAASRYRVVILQSWQTKAATTIKTLNPAVTVLAYKDLSSASFAEAALYNERNGLPMATGVGYLDAERNGWLAEDVNGARINWKGYPNLWQTEVWNPAYQQRWVDNVTRELRGSVFDGVFGDDALTTLRYYSAQTLAEAPTDADLQAGEEALIRKATAGLHGIGKKLVVNIAAATDHLPVWTRWSQLTDGAMLEHYAHWGSDPNSPSNYLWDWGSRGWTAGLTALGTSLGNVAVTTSADTDDRSYRYGLASFLLAGGGHGAFTAVDSYKKAPFRPEQAWDLGYATAPVVKAGAAYSRVFPNGFAAVNPSKDTTVVVKLPVPLTDVTGATVTSVTLPPLHGAVFKGATAVTTATATTKLKGKWRSAPKPLYVPGSVRAAAPAKRVTARPAAATARPAARPATAATGRAAAPAKPARAAGTDAPATVPAATERAAAVTTVRTPARAAAVRPAAVTQARAAAVTATPAAKGAAVPPGLPAPVVPAPEPAAATVAALLGAALLRRRVAR